MVKERTNQNPTPAAPRKSSPDADYAWLSTVEDKLVFAFVDDTTLLQRARTKIACRGTPAKPVKITLPPNRKGQLNVAAIGDSVNNLAVIAERKLDEDEEQAAQEKFTYWKSNRDLLAHRLGRESSTLRWKACRSDRYEDGIKSYQARLAAAGKELAQIGSVAEPANHRWMAKRPQAPVPGRSMEDRERDAQANAASLF